MKTTIELLRANTQVSDFKINTHRRESYELFFVKGRLETVRCTDTCDKEVTVYVRHGEHMGDAQFFLYPSTPPEEVETLIAEAVGKALLINNQPYALPAGEQGDYVVESNFAQYASADLAAEIAKTVFDANTDANGSLNSVEIFLTKHTESVLNSRGLDKTQVRYDAMVEAIPTYNGPAQSVELYEQYNFSAFRPADIIQEIADMMAAVRARYEAVKPGHIDPCPVILHKQELAQLFGRIAGDLNYTSVYSHMNLFKKGDAIQTAPTGDRLGITAAGQAEGSVRSTSFDGDGLTLGSIRLVEDGKAVNYYGGNRFGQYLGEVPTGALPCLLVDTGSADDAAFQAAPCLEVVSMSGLQVELTNDYIGGEIRLAYYRDGDKAVPVTGVSISGKLSQVLGGIRLSQRKGIHNGYIGPEKAILQDMQIF